MKQYLFFFLFCPFISFSQSILQSNDTIKFWNINDPLSFNDFQSDVIPSGKDPDHLGLCVTGWHIDYDVYNRVIAIRSAMSPSKSYLKSNSDSLTLLHETTHFRITELYLRHFLDSLLTYDVSLFLKEDFSIFWKLHDYYLDLMHRAQNEFDDKIYSDEHYVSASKEKEVCNEVLYDLSKTKANFDESHKFFLERKTILNNYMEYAKEGFNAFNVQDFKKSIILLKKALALTQVHEQNVELQNAIDIARKNIDIVKKNSQLD